MEIYMNNGDLEEALDECEFALQSEPTSFQTESVLYSRARILRELQRWSAALQTYEQLVLNNPGLAGAYFGMAEPLQMLGRSDEAIKNCRQALRLKPELEEARVTLAHLLTNEGYFKEAEEHIRLSLEIVMGKKQLARLWSYLGQVLDSGRVARNKEAEEAYRQALDLRPDYFEAHVGVAKALRHQGRLDESLNWNEKARLISPTDPTPLIGIAMCLMKQNRWPACLEAWRKYEQLGGRGKIAAYYSGIALEKIGDLSRARDEMNRARSLGYSSESVAASLARLDARA
jgi:tetratricopeptide (TPR) repeat protein